MDFLKFTEEKLSVNDISDLVTSSSCGAISLFVGVTRDNFEGQTVLKLEYEAYESMGIKSMKKICNDIRSKWYQVENIAIYHRLGTVPVKEASIIIAISSPHREDAIQATEYCINNVKKSVPIWKKEVYAESKPLWKENKESPKSYPPKLKKRNFDLEQKIDVPFAPPHLIQVKGTNSEVATRIDNQMKRKRSDLDVQNIKEFCCGDRHSEFTCARVEAVVYKRKDSKSHLQVRRVYNSYEHRDQKNSDYLTKFIPPNGLEERLENLECQLNSTKAVPKNVFKRLKLLEDRLLYLESVSPEYVQFWEKGAIPNKVVKKKVFSIAEIDDLIADVERKIGN